jgi:hypothetical protein
MSVSNAETLLQKAKQQVSQSDFNRMLILAIDELLREVRRVDDDIRRARRDIRVGRRF